MSDELALLRKIDELEDRVRELEAERERLKDERDDIGAAAWIMEWMVAEKYQKPDVPEWLEKARKHYREEMQRAERAEAELHFNACLVHDLLPYQERAVKAEAERDALRADAERYRWLRANARRIDFAGLSWTQGCELDARIDAAMKDKT